MKKAEEYNSKIIDEILNSVSSNEAKKVEKNMVLASKIYDAMKAKEWNKTDLAKALGKKNSVITKWLSGTHNFTADTLYDIEAVLEMSIISLDVNEKEQSISMDLTLSISNEPVKCGMITPHYINFCNTYQKFLHSSNKKSNSINYYGK